MGALTATISLIIGSLKRGGTTFAFVALMAAQVASTQFSLIYYQDCVPDKVRKLRDI